MASSVIGDSGDVKSVAPITALTLPSHHRMPLCTSVNRSTREAMMTTCCHHDEVLSTPLSDGPRLRPAVWAARFTRLEHRRLEQGSHVYLERFRDCDED